MIYKILATVFTAVLAPIVWKYAYKKGAELDRRIEDERLNRMEADRKRAEEALEKAAAKTAEKLVYKLVEKERMESYVADAIQKAKRKTS